MMLYGLAWGLPPLPDYTESVVQAEWHRIDSLIEAACDPGVVVDCEPAPLRDAIQRADAFNRLVTEDARIHYLSGLAKRKLGQREAAKTDYERAVELDPKRTDAWHDLGELALMAGDYPLADQAFERVSAGIVDGPKAWVGPWRRAEVAALRHDGSAFEQHLREAIRRGLSFDQVANDPRWRKFAADPALRTPLEKLLTVYGTAEHRNALGF